MIDEKYRFGVGISIFDDEFRYKNQAVESINYDIYSGNSNCPAMQHFYSLHLLASYYLVAPNKKFTLGVTAGNMFVCHKYPRLNISSNSNEEQKISSSQERTKIKLGLDFQVLAQFRWGHRVGLFTGWNTFYIAPELNSVVMAGVSVRFGTPE
ncbi:MAG: hypothetical protein KDC52_06570 [Ignavibacteriae bacterium]|nr:hypothetical protein [Ignavibacteriota bacterium]